MLYLIKGDINSGKTEYLINTMQKHKNSLFITNDSSVSYIQRRMAEMKVCGACVGISGLGSFLVEECGYPSARVTTKEEELLILAQTLDESRASLKVLSKVAIDSDDLTDIYKIIDDLEIQDGGVRHAKGRIDEIAPADRALYEDLIVLYEAFSNKVEAMGCVSSSRALNQASSRFASSFNKQYSTYDNIIIDTLDSYSPAIASMISTVFNTPKDYDVQIVLLTSYSYHTSSNTFQHILSYRFQETLNETILKMGNLEKRIIDLAANHTSGGIDTIARVFYGGAQEGQPYDVSGLHFNEFTDLQSETRNAAETIVKLVKAGYDPSDIVVTTSDPERYIDYLTREFEEHDIKYTYHESSRLKATDVYSLLDIVVDAARMDKITGSHIMRLIQIPFFAVTQQEKAAVSRFVRRFGEEISLAHANSAKFNNKAEHKMASSVIVRLMSSINPLRNAICFGDINTAIVEIYRLFAQLKVNDYYRDLAIEYQENGNTQKAMMIMSMWQKLTDTLEIIRRVYGSKQSTFELFQKIINRTFTDTYVSEHEEYYGQVSVMPINAAKNRRNKITFILGANENYFPSKIKTQMLSTYTRQRLNEGAYVGRFMTEQDMAAKALGDIYLTMTKPTDDIYISWANVDDTGIPMHRAVCIRNIIDACGDAVKETSIVLSEEERYIRLLGELENYKLTGVKSATMDEEYEYFKANNAYSCRLAVGIERASRDYGKINASKETIDSAYRNLDKMAITELESYASCPFQHFMKYAVRPKISKKFEENAADAGNFYHDVLKIFYDEVESAGTDYLSITMQDCYERVERICNTLIEEHNENVLNTSPALIYKKDLMIKQIKKAAWATLQQLQAGNFRISAVETVIDDSSAIVLQAADTEIMLTGKIDRVDTVNIGGIDYCRIIDYKSSRKKFSEDKVEAGLQLQLPLYSSSLPEKTAGIYYSTVSSPIKDADADDEVDLNKYQLSGLTLENKSVVYATDRALCEENTKSSIVNVSTLKSGDYSKRSSLIGDFAEVEGKAKMVAKGIVTEILDGNTKAHPWKETSFTACQYCEYRTVCRFNPLNAGNSYRQK